MFKKRCSTCGKLSYSASEDGIWLCPYCNADLKEEKILKAEDSETESSNENPLEFGSAYPQRNVDK